MNTSPTIICNILSNNDIFTINNNTDISKNDLNELKRLNKYYEASSDNYFKDVIDYEKNKIIKLLFEINDKIEYNKNNYDIYTYKKLLCEYEIEYNTSIKHLKNKLLFLDKLNDNQTDIINIKNKINENDEIIKIDISRLNLDISYNQHIYNQLKQSFEKKLNDIYNELLYLIFFLFIIISILK